MKAFKLILLILLLCENAISQDANFSQFYNNPVYYNPAMTAIGKGYTYRAHARNLWAPVPGRFNTFTASFEGEVLSKLGFGVLGFSDVAGEGLLRTVGGYLSYSYRPIETKNFMLQFGASGGLINKTIDWSRFTFSDQYDEVYGLTKPSQFIAPSNSVLYPDFSTGVAVRFNSRNKNSGLYKRMISTMGLGVNHVNQPKDGFMKDNHYLPLKLVAHANFSFLFGENLFSPGVIFEKQNEFTTFTAGLAVVNKPISVGVWFRNRTAAMSGNRYDSFIFTLGTHFPLPKERNLRVTYGIDFTMSKLRTSSFGSHELSLVYELDNRYILKGHHAKRKKKRTYQCPDDFNGYD